MAITEEDVFAAANALDAEGTRPTQKAVRDRLGGGSFTTIAAAMQRWHQRRVTPTPTRVPIPDSLSNSMSELLQQVWDAAVSEMDVRLLDERRGLREARAAQERELADMIEAMAVLQDERDAAKSTLEEQATLIQTLEREHRDALDRAIAAEARHSECAQALAAEREARQAAQRSLENALRANATTKREG